MRLPALFLPFRTHPTVIPHTTAESPNRKRNAPTSCKTLMQLRMACRGRLPSEELCEQVFSAKSHEGVRDLAAKLGFVPKEELPLRQLLLFGACRVDLL